MTSYHASLLNRDDAGLVKRIPFGGSERLHLSGQYLKRHWRAWLMEHSSLQMKQPVLFGRPEADFLVHLVREATRQGDEDTAKKWLAERIRESKKNFKVMLRQAGITAPAAGFEGALFGRFATSGLLARIDALVYDDLAENEETGAAHANDTELGVGIFYGYVVVDVPLLISNLAGCNSAEWREQDLSEAQALLEQFIRAIATVAPGAKLGATAPYARAERVLLEAASREALLTPISSQRR